ncbi:PEP-CTERM sorting domain-containing protein [Tundrisphaera sp. TA3]|uniref:PEP-CTERM sorting domain-containing protein n=1 Tax=Tundrisphaera sp. TA3 TaxID=3435775 RepID=UPI003EC1539D
MALYPHAGAAPRPRPARLAFAAALLIAAFGTAAAPARAALVVDVQSITVAPGSSGNALGITLTNTGPGSVTIAGFSFGLTTSPGITFTEADTSVASYIFAGRSLFGPIISITPPGTTLEASDNWDTPNAGVVLASGATVGLGRVLFNAAAAGQFPVALQVFPTTSLSGPTGANIPITTRNNGVITVGTQAVPEPSSAALLGLGLALVARARRPGKRRPPRRAA